MLRQLQEKRKRHLNYHLSHPHVRWMYISYLTPYRNFKLNTKFFKLSWGEISRDNVWIAKSTRKGTIVEKNSNSLVWFTLENKKETQIQWKLVINNKFGVACRKILLSSNLFLFSSTLFFPKVFLFMHFFIIVSKKSKWY